MPPDTSSPDPEDRQQRQKNQKNENDEWQKLLLALLFLLISFVCILCSSHSALWLINRDSIEGNMLSARRADYGPDSSSLQIAPLSEEIIAEAARDEADLSEQPLLGAGIPIAVLPNPLPTPLPQPTPVPPTLTPSPTPTPTPSDSSQPTSAPPPTQPLQPTEEPTSAPTQAPTQPPPTQPPPTSPPPTSPPPTSPPPTSPPPTSPPPTSPPPPPLPVVSFSVAGYSVNEGDGSAPITVVLNTTSAQTVTVKYATSDGTATAGSDYTATSGTLTFSPGQTSRSFTVPIRDDSLANEPDETVLLSLSNPGNATLGTPQTATLSIVDNDVPTVQFSSPAYSVAEDNGPAVITVTLDITSTQAVTVEYATSNGTATAGSDYIATSGTVTFSPGQTSRTFDLSIIDDSLDEPDETVQLTLSNPSNATLGAPNPAALTIVDDDPQPTVDFESDTYFVDENNGPAVITVTLSAASAQTVTVDYATNPGGSTAVIGSDYVSASGTLTFTSGITGQIFNVQIIDDAGNEPDEVVELALSNPTDANLGAANNPALLNIVDDDTAAPPCGDNVPVGTVNVGPPDCQYTLFGSNVITVDLVAAGSISITVDGNSDFDLVYYERDRVTPPGEIALDIVQVQVATNTTATWYTVFFWGDGILDDNTNIGQAGFGGGGPPSPGNELDNTTIPMTNPPLYQSSSGGPISGIAIDVDNVPAAVGSQPPPGQYRYIRLIGNPPGPGGGQAEVDSIEVLPP